MILTVNSGHFPKQHYPVAICDEGLLCPVETQLQNTINLTYLINVYLGSLNSTFLFWGLLAFEFLFGNVKQKLSP